MFRISALYCIQEILSLKQEGDLKLMTLRKKGESIYAHQTIKRDSFEQNQRELKEEWARVLQIAQDMKNQIEGEDSLSKELKSFQDQLERAQVWIKKLKMTLQSMDRASPAEEIINQAQVQNELNISILYFCISCTCLKMYIYNLYMKQVYRNVKYRKW